jgi:hypothetical protein
MKVAVEGNTENGYKKPLTIQKVDSFADLLKQTQKDAPTPATNREKKKKKKKSPHASTFEHEDENLGDDFEATPWLPPSIEKAAEFKNRTIFRQVRLDSINLIQAPDLGNGVTLYFQFAMSMALTLAVMSLLSLPSLIMIYPGSGIAPQDRDAFSLYRYTIGNMGAYRESKTYAHDSQCFSGSYAANTTCIHFGNNNELSISDAQSILTAMEFCQLAVFFIAVFYMQSRVFSVAGRAAKTVTAISDYSIIVR